MLVVAGCANEPATLRLIREVLAELGVVAPVRRTVVTSDHDAQRRGFVGSPTVLVDGTDPCPEPDARPGLACRVYATASGRSGVPDRAVIRDAIRAAARLP